MRTRPIGSRDDESGFEPTDRAPSGQVGAGADIPVPKSRRTDSSTGVFGPDESNRASEQARGQPNLAYESRSERFERRRRRPVAGAGRTDAERAALDAERPNAPLRADSSAGANRSSAEQPDPRPSNQI
jgi:hypothetical protein